MARVTATVATFNSGRTSENGFYAISIATPYRRYYALWRIFADERPPLFIRTLADTFVICRLHEFKKYDLYRVLHGCNVLRYAKEESNGRD
jgi:hypothetical protein